MATSVLILVIEACVCIKLFTPLRALVLYLSEREKLQSVMFSLVERKFEYPGLPRSNRTSASLETRPREKFSPVVIALERVQSLFLYGFIRMSETYVLIFEALERRLIGEEVTEPIDEHSSDGWFD